MLKKYCRIAKISLFLFVISITPACKKAESGLQGYIEARLAFISTNYAGTLQKLLVRRGAKVKPGQLLFVLESQPESDIYLQAKADLDSAVASQGNAEANLAYERIIFDRRKSLLKSNSISAEEFDNACIRYKNAVDQLTITIARVNSAKARLKNTVWSTSKKSVISYETASVFDTYFLPSELVPANQPVLSLIIPHEIRVIFFVKETALSSINTGDIIHVRCDGYSKLVPAKISYISQRAELTPPVLYTVKERAKFVYRVEADRVSNNLNCFHPGQPVTIFLNSENKK